MLYSVKLCSILQKLQFFSFFLDIKIIDILKIMEKYYCQACDYCTSKTSSFKDHFKSKSHQKKSLVRCNENTDYTQFRIKEKNCVMCGDSYKEGILASEHVCDKNKIIERTLLEKNKEITNYKKEIELLKKELKEKDKLVSKALDATISSSKTANTSMNILRYAKTYWNNVDPIEEINDENICKVMNYKNPKNEEYINETYVKTLIHRYNHGIFSDFIGDMIIEYYKPKSSKKRNIMVSDMARLCFIIMQKIEGNGKEKKEWMNDKSGKTFTKIILDPMFAFVKKLLNDYIILNQKKELTENTLKLMSKCAELNRDIDVKVFSKSVLKYVGPHFHFDKLKFIDEEPIFTESESSKDDVPKKKPKKIIVNKKENK